MAQAYAEAYRELLTWQLRQAERADDTQRGRLLADLGEMLAIDTVEASVTGQDGVRRPVVLTSPLHPLRLLWLVTWAELGQHWLESSADAAPEPREASGRTLADLMPLGFPFVVPLSGGRLTMAAADLTPYWGACLPTDTPDPQSLLATLARALQLPERGDGHAVPPRVLADRVERYLRLHPYVSTLVISAVNPGRGEQLADMLVELQRRKHLQHVNYDIRIFVPDFDGANTQAGEALAALMRGEWTTGAVAEAFSTRQSSGLIPKLAAAVLPLPEFRAATDERPSHLTFLFDAFSGETFGAAVAAATRAARCPCTGSSRTSSSGTPRTTRACCGGNSRDTGGRSRSRARENSATSSRCCPPRSRPPLPRWPRAGRGRALVPEVTLGLSASDGALLHQAHRSSDWVITVDRTLGMEYFDSPGSARRPDYVIDFEGFDGGELGPPPRDQLPFHRRAARAAVAGDRGARAAGGSAARGNVLRAAPAAVRPARVQAGVHGGLAADGSARPGARQAVPGLPGRASRPDRGAAGRPPGAVPGRAAIGLRRGRGGFAATHGPGAMEPGRSAADDHVPARRSEVLQRGTRRVRI